MHHRLAILLVAIVSSTLFVAAYHGSWQENAQELEKKITALQTQRRDILQKHVELLEQRHKQGEDQTKLVMIARNKLYLAQLDLASTPADRIKIAELRVKNLKRLEAVAQTRYKNGIGPYDD